MIAQVQLIHCIFCERDTPTPANADGITHGCSDFRGNDVSHGCSDGRADSVSDGISYGCSDLRADGVPGYGSFQRGIASWQGSGRASIILW